jgi:putative addiction module component (TIGR02574 family)
MTTAAEKIKADALHLSETERAEIARSLILSLDDKLDEDAEAAWDAELERRLEEVEAERASGRPAEAVLREIRAKYGR